MYACAHILHDNILLYWQGSRNLEGQLDDVNHRVSRGETGSVDALILK